MNIKITYNWLLEYLDTDADVYDLQKHLSVSGPSIERIEEYTCSDGTKDYVLDIEITTNRIDMASVFGIAQEANAILPQYGFEALLKQQPLTKYSMQHLSLEPSKRAALQISIENKEFCPRFTAMVIGDVNVTQSPAIIRDRLLAVGIHSLNNIIDISNYVMIELGQPLHMFDFDRMKDGVMKLRESRKGESIRLLDGTTVSMPGGDIVIEGADGALIDLCGIMGGENSCITKDTTRIVLFAQTYNKRMIRRTSMRTGVRTTAATYFEKGLDPSRAETAFVKASELLCAQTNAVAESEVYDIYPHVRHSHEVNVYLSDIRRVMGIAIEEQKVISILTALGFGIRTHDDKELAYPDGLEFHISVPTYRTDDIKIKEDVIEEVARIYGYDNLPSAISPLVFISQPRDIERRLQLLAKLKILCKALGWHEVMSYSMVSKKLLTQTKLDPTRHLKLATTISTEIEFMRQSLLPSLIRTASENEGRVEHLRFFEVSNTYIPRSGELPDEILKCAWISNTKFEDVKGLSESILSFFHLDEFIYMPSENPMWNQSCSSDLVYKGTKIGTMGTLASDIQRSMGLLHPIFGMEFDFSYLEQYARSVHTYAPPAKNAIIKLDVNIERKGRMFQQISQEIRSHSNLLSHVEFVSTFKNHYAVRLFFTAQDRNLTESEAKNELAHIVSKVG